MTAAHEIHCDGCGRDITYTGNCYAYRLVLRSEAKDHDYVNGSAAVTAMHIPDPLPEPKHFCGVECLPVWLQTGGPPREGGRTPSDYDVLEAPAARYAGEAILEINGEQYDLNEVESPFEAKGEGGK